MSIAGRNTTEWYRLRLRCYERDKARDARCWLCGGRIRYDLKPSSHPDAYEPDHRYTVHDHPELAELPENIMPSHRRCNRRRGSKAGLSELGNRSRDWGNPRG